MTKIKVTMIMPCLMQKMCEAGQLPYEVAFPLLEGLCVQPSVGEGNGVMKMNHAVQFFDGQKALQPKPGADEFANGYRIRYGQSILLRPLQVPPFGQRRGP